MKLCLKHKEVGVGIRTGEILFAGGMLLASSR